MGSFTRRPLLAWLVPLAFVLGIGGAGGIVAVTAVAESPLPPRTAEQLLVDLQNASVDGLSGTVEQTAALGLPELPTEDGSDSSFSALLSGTNTLRVWYDSPDKSRVAVMGTFGESDVIKNGNDLWIWSSKDNTVKHATLEDKPDGNSDQDGSEEPMTPEAAADKILDALTPTTDISSTGTATVADRQAYELVLDPQDDRSLVKQIRIAIDAEHSVPLRVQVMGSGDDPAFSVAYTDIEFGPPDASVFEFTPPTGATVTEIEPKAHEHSTDPESEDRPTVVGEGWTRVTVAKTGDLQSTDNAQLQQLLGALPRVSGEWGTGRLVEGTIFSAVVTDDGRVAFGAVQPDLLYAALDR